VGIFEEKMRKDDDVGIERAVERMNSGDKSNTSKKNSASCTYNVEGKGMRRCFPVADKDAEELVSVIQCWIHSCQKHSYS
jgi:hypothetical protein